MEMDCSIALFIREQREREEEEKRRELREKHDPRKWISYTLEELTEGIKKGKQYIYTLRLEFETRELLSGRIKIPYIKDFFDVNDDEPETALLASNRHKVTMNISDAPCNNPQQPFEEWIAQTKEAMKAMHLHMKLEKKETVGEIEYFCFTMPTSAGQVYSVMFRLQKNGRLCVGASNCMEEEREGMGLLLEAMVHVIEEINR
ncbi:MAG: hypothetical protein NC307_14785 [Roseburia sp.]|nr:hypothetical protein [Roseburia sp.]